MEGNDTDGVQTFPNLKRMTNQFNLGKLTTYKVQRASQNILITVARLSKKLKTQAVWDQASFDMLKYHLLFCT